MPKPNYAFAKRQRELDKKRKKEDKALQRNNTPQSGEPQTDEPQNAATPGAQPPNVNQQPE